MKQVLALFLLFGITFAQQDWTPPLPQNAQAIATNEDLVQTLNTASQEIMLAAPFLHSPELADAIRIAIVERGVAVFILAPQEGIGDQASYLLGLALAGAALSVAPAQDAFLIIDRTTFVTGPLVSGLKQLPGQTSKQSYYISDATQASAYVDSFYQSYSVAGAYDSETFVNRMKDEYLEQMELDTNPQINNPQADETAPIQTEEP